ncbi:DUF4439 domain-containing protein [Actinomadura atramentaria]|uniref:DUF4439 domain-containing protein n=1 Tax=Actinomadura atramentaria TaxID=1990 RepID=UPI00037B4760|nr:DUF4439 domain-containing protein [Actinomadura atramentaria]
MSGRGAAELGAAVAAEHAAVYGYGVLGARLSGAARETATLVWNAHRAARDALADRLTALGAPVPAAAPVYRLPVRATDARSAARLAALLEDGVAAGYAGLAGAADPALRTLAARAMQEAARRAAHWRARAGESPDPVSAFPGLPSSSLGPKPQPGGEPEG